DIKYECLEYLIYIVYNTIYFYHSTSKTTTVIKTFSSNDSRFKLTADSFVLTEQITNFSCTDADITCRYIQSRSNMFGKFCHKALAKAHNFSVRFIFWIEIRATFSTTNRLPCKCVFKRLLEP